MRVTAKELGISLDLHTVATLPTAVLVRYETFLRPAERRWPEWIAAQTGKIRAGLDALEAEGPS